MSSVKRNSVSWVIVMTLALPICDLFLILCYRRRTLIASTTSFSWLSAVESFSSDTSLFWRAFVLERVGVKLSQMTCSEANSPGQQLLSSEKVRDWVLCYAFQDHCSSLSGRLQWFGNCLRKDVQLLYCVHFGCWWFWYSPKLRELRYCYKRPLSFTLCLLVINSKQGVLFL